MNKTNTKKSSALHKAVPNGMLILLLVSVVIMAVIIIASPTSFDTRPDNRGSSQEISNDQLDV